MFRSRLGALAILGVFLALPGGHFYERVIPAATPAAAPTPHHARLELQDSFDDALMACGEFLGDRRLDDPDGIDAVNVWRETIGDQEVGYILSGHPPWEPDHDAPVREWRGHWIHYRTIDGRLQQSDESLLEYRLHDGDHDYWGWFGDGEEFYIGPTYELPEQFSC